MHYCFEVSDKTIFKWHLIKFKMFNFNTHSDKKNLFGMQWNGEFVKIAKWKITFLNEWVGLNISNSGCKTFHIL
jgi:hypothetical protein